MKVIVQRVLNASVTVNDEIVSSIQKGLLLLVGFEKGDTEQQLKWCAEKISKLRIFEDEQGKMNLNIHQVQGEILSVSQFTLAADIQKSNRPSFTNSQDANLAKDQFDQFNHYLGLLECKVSTGIFQEDMKVSLVNDGPVTIIVER